MAFKYFSGSSEPVGAELFDFWVKPNLEEWFKTESGWVLQRCLGQPNGGLLPKTGGIMTGAEDGAHGHAPLDSPNMTGTPKINDQIIVTQDVLEAMMHDLNERITSSTGGTGGGTTGGTGSGILSACRIQTKWCAEGVETAFDLPDYKGGGQATIAECKAVDGTPNWGFAIAGLSVGKPTLQDPQSNLNGNFPFGATVFASTDKFACTLKGQDHNGRLQGALVLGFCFAQK